MAVVHFTCPHCSQYFDFPETIRGSSLPCPVCGQTFEVPALAAPASGPVCAICLSPLGPADMPVGCPACHAPYHTDCWQENGGCAVYGCSQAPTVEQRRAIEIPVSYWGQENKNCPRCNREILAAAVRCRFCGATFESARPQGAEEFRQRTELTQQLPAARRMIIWIFVFSVLPCLAPIGAIWGSIWYPLHREEVRALPTLYGALCKIGLGVGIGQTVAIVLVTVVFSFVRH
jgi:hypothetical protein